jgi:hypothetical protein
MRRSVDRTPDRDGMTARAGVNGDNADAVAGAFAAAEMTDQATHQCVYRTSPERFRLKAVNHRGGTLQSGQLTTFICCNKKSAVTERCEF